MVNSRVPNLSLAEGGVAAGATPSPAPPGGSRGLQASAVPLPAPVGGPPRRRGNHGAGVTTAQG